MGKSRHVVPAGNLVQFHHTSRHVKSKARERQEGLMLTGLLVAVPSCPAILRLFALVLTYGALLAHLRPPDSFSSMIISSRTPPALPNDKACQGPSNIGQSLGLSVWLGPTSWRFASALLNPARPL